MQTDAARLLLFLLPLLLLLRAAGLTLRLLQLPRPAGGLLWAAFLLQAPG